MATPPSPDEIPDGRSEIEATGLFEGVRVTRHWYAILHVARRRA